MMTLGELMAEFLEELEDIQRRADLEARGLPTHFPGRTA